MSLPIPFPISFYSGALLLDGMVRNRDASKTNVRKDVILKAEIIVSAIIILTVILFIWLSAPSEGAVIVVDDDGNADYSTIQDGVNSSKDGDTVLVHDGLYQEHIVLTKRINLFAVENETPTIDAGGKGSVLYIKSAGSDSQDYINIKGFLFQNSGSHWHPDYDSGIEIEDSSYMNISGNKFMNNGMGIYLHSSSRISIKSNYFHGNEQGVRSRDLDSSPSENVLIMNNTILNSESVGISLSGSNHIIVENVIRSTGKPDDNGEGIRLSCDDTDITGNDISEGYGWGIYVNGNGNSMESNIISNNTHDGIQIMGSSNTVRRNKISGNRIGISPISSGDASWNVVRDNELVGNGVLISQWSSDFTLVMENNTLDGRQVYFYKGIHGTPKSPMVIEFDAGTVILFDCSYFEIRYNNITNGAVSPKGF